MDLRDKLNILGDAAKYDVSCSSSGSKRNSPKGGMGCGHSSGICHTWSADGRCISLLKVLFSNACKYDCAYCVNRRSNDIPRATFTPKELINLTLEFYRRNYIEGLFLSSAVIGTPRMPCLREASRKYREQLGIPVARLRRLIVLLFLLAGTHSLMAQTSYYDSIISLRLEASRQTTPTVSEKKAPATATPSVSPKKTEKPTPATEQPTPDTKANPSMVPMWYETFPHNRVNPLGRTKLDMLPDEINLLLVRDSADFCFPVKGLKSSAYGWRWHRGHHGVDIALRTGEPIRAAFGGTVRIASRMGGYGNCIVVRHPNGLETLYGHLSKINVHTNQQVSAGEVIGLGGSSGNSTGPHLHFECRFLYQTFDPEWILDFKNYALRTRRLHLDKSYFGIRQPRKGETLDYKADGSIIREGKKRPKNQPTVINPQDF